MNFLNEFIMPDLIIAMVGSYFLVGARDQYIYYYWFDNRKIAPPIPIYIIIIFVMLL